MKATFDADGFLSHRTRSMPYEHAESFCKCLNANGTFLCAEVRENERAKTNRRYFVAFRPANPDRMSDLAEREQSARIQRADREGADYLFFLDTDGPRPFYRVYNPLSGEVYELDSSLCSCPDFVYRCGKCPGYGLKCKHQHEMVRRFEAGELQPLSEVIRTYGTRRYTAADLVGVPVGSW